MTTSPGTMRLTDRWRPVCTTWLAALLVTAGAGPALENESRAPQTPAYLVHFSGASLRADGRLDESGWRAAPWSTDFVWIDTGEPAPLESRFKAWYSPEGLHFAFRFEAVPSQSKPLDPDFPRACEVFLDPEGRGRRYLEFAVDPAGQQHAVIWNGRLSMSQWRGEEGPAARVGIVRAAKPKKRETVVYEMSFSWVELGRLADDARLPPAKGAAWRVNFSRVETAPFAGDYVWSPMSFYYMHHPGRFGWLVFAGDKDPLPAVDVSQLPPVAEDALQIKGSSRMPLFSRCFWTRFPLWPAADGGYYAVHKCGVTKLDAQGIPEWSRMHQDGLPRFVRSVACAADQFYVAGDGPGAGLAVVFADGRVRRIHDHTVTLLPMDERYCLATWGNRLARVASGRMGSVITCGGNVHCAAPLSNGRLVVGTDDGFELYGAGGQRLQHVSVAGGITVAMTVADRVVGVSGKDGLFWMDGSGRYGYYPHPLRTRFEAIFNDGLDGCWASYTGGLVHIQAESVTYYDEPLDLAGFHIVGAAPLGDGQMVFAGALPNASWYRSSRQAPFLLTFDGRRWRKIGFQEGLPGRLNAVARIRENVFLSTNAGVFRFIF